MPEVYRIKPLEWVVGQDRVSGRPWATYYADPCRDANYCITSHDTDGVTWSSDRTPETRVHSLLAAKAACEAHWRERIGAALVEVEICHSTP